MELFEKDIWGNPIKPYTRSLLADDFIEPPFSVLNGRNQSRRWTQRKNSWMSLLPKLSEEYEGDYKLGSVFDPVLCEIMYTWFCRPGRRILDPFAGGPIRGMVALTMGYDYYGIELRQAQVEYNKSLCNGVYVSGDAYQLVKDAPESDFIFSCPPYGDLEVYSNDLKDLSTMSYDRFIDRYNSIILSTVSRLKGDYAAFVVGNYRDSNGYYYNFVGDTIRAFENAGMRLYNDIIYLTPIGSAFMRAKKFFTATKKVVKVHQNILVFKKGDK